MPGLRADVAGGLRNLATGGRHPSVERPVRHVRCEEASRLGASAARRAARRRGCDALERGLCRALDRPAGPLHGAALGALGDEVTRRERLSRPTLVAGVIGARARPGQVLVRNCAQHAASVPDDGVPLSEWRLAELGPRLGEQLVESATLPEVPGGLGVADLAAELPARMAVLALDVDVDDKVSGDGNAVKAPAAGGCRAVSTVAELVLAEPGGAGDGLLAPGVWQVGECAEAEGFVQGLAAGRRRLRRRSASPWLWRLLGGVRWNATFLSVLHFALLFDLNNFPVLTLAP
ncbi:unnamed protein product, partial [Prorocentrum cordatum]